MKIFLFIIVIGISCMSCETRTRLKLELKSDAGKLGFKNFSDSTVRQATDSISEVISGKDTILFNPPISIDSARKVLKAKSKKKSDD